MDHDKPSDEHLMILKKFFGHNSFKKEQWEAISSLIYNRRDCLIVAGIGFGERLIYQFIALFLKKIVIVVSPLIKSMKDEVSVLHKKGIKAYLFESSQKDLHTDLNNFQIVYVTPEFLEEGGRAILISISDKICLIVVDECHCMSQLGSDFRSSYRRICDFKNYLDIPLIALTTAANHPCQRDICSILDIKNPLIVKAWLNRNNLEYSVIKSSHGFFEDIKHHIADPSTGSTIIYSLRRGDAEAHSRMLNEHGIQCESYHDEVSDILRKQLLLKFSSGTLHVICTTMAFAKGIDRSDVRSVIHYGMPKNLESYYQESGRAGRDGKPSKCTIFWKESDFDFHQYWLKMNREKMTEEYYEHAINQLNIMKRYLESSECRRMKILRYFDLTAPMLPITESCCDNCFLEILRHVKLHKIYIEIDSANRVDLSEDIRMMLRLIASYDYCEGPTAIKFLRGEMPNEFDSCHQIKFFGIGKNKPEEWWKIIADLLLQNHYVKGTGCRGKITNTGRKFIRMKTRVFKTSATPNICKFLTKGKFEYFIENGIVKKKFRKIDKELKEPERMSISNKKPTNNISLFDFENFHMENKLPAKKPRNNASDDEDSEQSCSHWKPSESALFCEDETDDEYLENVRTLYKMLHKPINVSIEDFFIYLEDFYELEKISNMKCSDQQTKSY